MNKKFFLLVPFVLILCLLPAFLRLSQSNTTIPGVEPYYHLCVSDNYYTVLWEPFNFVISSVNNLFGDVFLFFLPSIIGFVSFLLFWFIIKKLNFNEFWFSFAFVFSSVFVTFSFFAFRYGFVLCLILAGIFLLLSEKFKFLGFIFFILAALSGLTSFFAVVYFTLVLLILRPKLKAWCFAVLVFLFFILLLNHFPLSISYNFGFSEVFSDFGGVFGFGFFTFILSVMGAVKLWRNKTRYYSLFVLTLAFFVLSYFFPALLVFGSVILACLSGTALSWLLRGNGI